MATEQKSSNQSTPVNRRNFLRGGAGLALGLTAANYRALAANAPSDTIRVGHIGVGGMGTNRLKSFIANDDVHCVGICDVDESHAAAAVAEVEKRNGYKPDSYHDFRKLIDRNDVDAVVVTTPDHWHCLPTVTACDAGKDVFFEKPMCHSINEGRAMVEAVKRNKRITQMGNHIHNDLNNYRRVVEVVRSGKLGKITKVALWKRANIQNLDHPADCDPPAELDYDFWQGPAPKRPYNPNRSHFNFRYFWDYSGGDFMDFWCHITDVAFWALDLGGPETVSAVGGRFFNDDNAETPDQLDVLMRFPDLTLTWDLHPNGLPGYEEFGSIGCVFQGRDATLVTNYGQNKIFVDGKEAKDFERPPESIPNSPGHIREFLNSIKSRELTTCNAEYAFRLTKPGLLSNIAYRVGETLHWDDEKEKVIGNYRANKLVTRDYRRPWRL
ncbi:MAG: gfo/Idh/MocA family oxidoreductase [bacterium]|nr:gfo/Idh/MocA family oxidoreductase [bacterium]